MTLLRASGWWIVVVGLSLTSVSAWSADSSDAPRPAPAAPINNELSAAKETAVDRYAVPNGDVAALAKFIDQVRAIRPATRDEFLIHREQAPRALREAAQRILLTEKDPTSESYKKAKGVLFEQRVKTLSEAAADEQARILEEIAANLREREADAGDFALALSVAPALEYSGQTELAGRVYRLFGEALKANQNPQIAGHGEMLVGAARRLDLVGKPLEVRGTALDGRPFDLAQLKGKVVLVDFWATWCGPCRAELPNVRRYFDLYHDQGFEVMGINLDRDRKALEQFLEKEALPWITLYEPDAKRQSALAVSYGVLSIPTVLLVDQKGKTVSLNARGPELGRLLEQLLGPPTIAAEKQPTRRTLSGTAPATAPRTPSGGMKPPKDGPASN